MAGKETVKAVCKIVRPLMSTDYYEARRRALGLYRAFYRYIPYISKLLIYLRPCPDLTNAACVPRACCTRSARVLLLPLFVRLSRATYTTLSWCTRAACVLRACLVCARTAHERRTNMKYSCAARGRHAGGAFDRSGHALNCAN